MRWPLRYQIMVPMAAVMLLAVVFVEGVGALLAVRDTKQQIEAQIREVARIAAEATFPAHRAGAAADESPVGRGADCRRSDRDRRLPRVARSTARETLPTTASPRARSGIVGSERVELARSQLFSHRGSAPGPGWR